MKQLVYRQRLLTRLTHWLWAICIFFLLFSGTQIFNAHPTLYLGNESGFNYDNSVLSVYAVTGNNGPEGRIRIFGEEINTTGVFGVSGDLDNRRYQGFPSTLTIPSYRDLASGRIVHFFLAWLFVVNFFFWLLGGFANKHIQHDILPSKADLRRLPNDFIEHLRIHFHHRKQYNPSQKLMYFGVMFGLFPLIIVTGLAMSPGADSILPMTHWLGGRQTARTLHFAACLLIIGFFAVHIVMVLVAGPVNQLRSIVSGWFKVDVNTDQIGQDHD